MIVKSSFLFILLGLTINAESRLTPVIRTTTGPIQGEILTTVVRSIEYSSFKGIPYGEPPTGYLRFKPPIPKKPWKDTLKTIVEGSNCVQNDFVWIGNYTGSEDCLFLNVYTPKLDFKNVINLLPVMVWIHGGSFKNGYGNSSFYGPDFIIEEGVVLVTLNYRLGPLGFLNLNHENATGNAALKDQNLAMRWVKANINKFGGDPNGITLFGQSAGGAAVDFHVLSDMSKGLFNQSISMSGSPLCPWAFYKIDVAIKNAFQLGQKLGSTSLSKDALLKTLYSASAVDIMKKAEEIGGVDPPFKPSIENPDLAKHEEKFLTECSYRKYVTGNFYKTPHMTGFTAFETILFGESAETVLQLVEFSSRTLNAFADSSSLPLPNTRKSISGIADGVITNLTNYAIMGLINETSDLIFVAGIDIKQKLLHSYSGYPLYYYRFSYDTQQSLHKLLYGINLNGTTHGDDLPYLFHNTILNFPLDAKDPTFITRKRMVRLWTNFAKYGTPTPHGKEDTLLQGVTWPSVGDATNYLEIGENLVAGKKPTSTSVDIIEVANVAILAIQTGCIGAIINQLSSLNPFASSVSTESTKVLDPLISKIPNFLG